MVTKIKVLIRKVSFVPKFELMTKYKNKDCEFNSDPSMHWMKWCDDKVHRVLKTIRSKNAESNMVRFGKWSIRVNYGVMDSNVREAVRIIDVMDSESNYLIDK